MKNYTFIDFDGVILDSEQRMLERKFELGFTNHKDKIQFNKFFEYTNQHPEEWNYIIKQANQINDSINIIKELESLKKEIAILTKIHTLYEMKVKVEEIRTSQKINCPIIFVPPDLKKHQIIIPNGQVLIDDSAKNIAEWISHGGKGYIFEPNISNNTLKKVKSLEFLLKE